MQWLESGAVMALVLITTARGEYVGSNVKPPLPAREFRGTWIATVKNIDWPSRPGLSTDQQKAELLALLDQAAKLKLNAVILQVRPSCDAFYASSLEPWSEYLTGKMGQAPSPFYDPLDFAVEKAHQRGLELHAWFNPYRARHESAIAPPSQSHISQRHPRLTKKYGKALWLDPGEKAVQDHALNVILDVLRRYDIDGVHLDDYFYPYQVKDQSGGAADFPDWTSWQKYLDGGGKLSRSDWRRDNVDRFVERLYLAIKQEKPAVKFGISPFGIWRPGHPPSIRGMDAYERIFADSRKWLSNGWVDYFSPQLYWRIDPPEQSFPVLLKWWAEQNGRHRHLWPGLAVSRLAAGWPIEEVANQVRLSRQQPGASGNLYWSAKTFMMNRAGVNELFLKEIYTQPALPPPSPWLDAIPPGIPRLSVATNSANGAVRVSWDRTGTEAVWLWVFQSRTGKDWSTEIMPGRETVRLLAGRPKPDLIALTAVDRCANASIATVVEWRTPPAH